MFGWIKNICENIKALNFSVDEYKNDSIIQSLPSIACVNRAKKLIDQKQFDEATTLLKKALDISNQDSLAYKYLGKISEYKGQFSTAVENYEQAAKIAPNDKEIWLRLGMSYLNCEKFDNAIEAFETADKVTPCNTDVQTGWGMALMRQKKFALARDKFLTAIKISKYNFTAILLSAVMEIKLNDFEAAEMKLKFLAQVAPNEGSLYEYAHLKLLKSDFKEAEKYAKKAIEINKHMLPAYFILGEIYSLQKNLEKTEQNFNKALENDLEDCSFRFEWGKAYMRLFEFSKAKTQFEKSIEQNDSYLGPKIGLALVNAYDGDFFLLGELKEKHGDNTYIQEAIGLENLAQGKIEEAIDFFKKALRTDNKQTYNYLNLVECYKKLGDNYKVREYYEKFISENPNYIEGLLSYSRWLVDVSDFQDAQRKLRRAEKLAPENSEVLSLLFLCLYTLVKNNICEYNIREAISVAEKASKISGNFKYQKEKEELENILIDIQGNN